MEKILLLLQYKCYGFMSKSKIIEKVVFAFSVSDPDSFDSVSFYLPPNTIIAWGIDNVKETDLGR